MSKKNNYLDATSHFSLIDNHDVQDFLKSCDFLIEPSDEQIEEIKSFFEQFNSGDNSLPENVITLDSDMYESSVRDNIPFTNVGYVKAVSSLLKRKRYMSMSGVGFVDPFEVAKMTKDKEEMIMVLPSSNMSYKKQESVRDGFRLALEEHFEKIFSDNQDTNTSLKATLFWLASYRKNGIKNKILLHECPNCKTENIEVLNIRERQKCTHCEKPIYATDCLRIFEAVDEASASNKSALGRLRVVIKHIYLAHLIRMIILKNKDTYLGLLSDLAFIVSGTLSIAGQPAWVHGSMMKVINEINAEMKKQGKRDLMIIGLVNEHLNIVSFAELISSNLEKSSLLCVSDEFRDKYIDFNREPSSTTFGAETYYGQDFVYKSKNSKMFVFDLPYTFPTKENKESFIREKSKKENYNNLSAAIQLIDEFECDLSEGNIVPLVLSEKYTAVSLEPGASVLDLLTRNSLA